jgi:Serpin (serine protease inhibitor)
MNLVSILTTFRLRRWCAALLLISLVPPQPAPANRIGPSRSDVVVGKVLAAGLCRTGGDGNVVAPQAVEVLLGLLAEAQGDLALRDDLRLQNRQSVLTSGLESFVVPGRMMPPNDVVTAWTARYRAHVLAREDQISASAGFDVSRMLPSDRGLPLLLAVTQYANERWSQPFPNGRIRTRVFHAASGPRSVRFMSDARVVQQATSSGQDLIALAYSSHRRLVVTMENDTTPCRDAQHLATTDFGKVAWHSIPVRIALPEFHVETALDMLPIVAESAPSLLSASTFTPGVSVVTTRAIANFSVNPSGTIGSAVSYAEIAYSDHAEIRPVRSIDLNRPFAFCLVDQRGAVLFAGTYQ